MENKLLDRIRVNLQEKRENLASWLASTPKEERKIRFGPVPERALHDHLAVLDTALEKTVDRTLGQCEVCHQTIESALLEMDYTCCVCLTHLTPEETRQLEGELELAQRVQRSLLPQEAPVIPGLDIAAYSRPAQIVGGDYFDFFEFGNGRSGMAIADVAGHGMSASLHMASVQTLLRTLAPDQVSPAAVAAEMQRLCSHNVRFTTFVTLFLAAYDHENRTLIYCNAGHNPPLLIRPAQKGERNPIWLAPTGPAIGLVEGAVFQEGRITLQPGDLLVMYTDGLTEASNTRKEAFGPKRLAALLSQQIKKSAGEALRTIRDDLAIFTAGEPVEDDLTLIVVKLIEV